MTNTTQINTKKPQNVDTTQGNLETDLYGW